MADMLKGRLSIPLHGRGYVVGTGLVVETKPNPFKEPENRRELRA